MISIQQKLVAALSIVLELKLAFYQPVKNFPCPLCKSKDVCLIKNGPQFVSVVS